MPGLAHTAWSPKLLSSLILDVNADAIAGNDGDLVSAWANRAPTGSTFDYQAAGALRPTLKRSIIGGHSTVLFDGAANVMWSTGTPTNGAFAQYVVFKTVVNPGASAFGAISFIADGAGTWSPLYVMNLGGYQPYTFIAKVSTSAIASSGIANALDTSSHVLGVRYNNGTNTSPGSYTCSLDGTTKTVVASGAAASLSTLQTSVGGRRASGGSTDHFWNGHLARQLLFSGTVSDAADAAIVQYLRNLYGI